MEKAQKTVRGTVFPTTQRAASGAERQVNPNSIGPSHGFAHVRNLGQPVRVMGLEVQQGDLIHADRHGAVVVPPEVVAGLEAAIRKLQET